MVAAGPLIFCPEPVPSMAGLPSNVLLGVLHNNLVGSCIGGCGLLIYSDRHIIGTRRAGAARNSQRTHRFPGILEEPYCDIRVWEITEVIEGSGAPGPALILLTRCLKRQGGRFAAIGLPGPHT